MTCSNCVAWCATTEAMHANRLANIAAAPQVKPYECPNCGGTDWATETRYIVSEPERRSAFRRLFEKVVGK